MVDTTLNRAIERAQHLTPESYEEFFRTRQESEWDENAVEKIEEAQ